MKPTTDCVVEPTDDDLREMSYIMCLMDLHSYVVAKGYSRVIDDLNRLLAAQERPWEPYKASRDTIDQEEQLSYDPRNFGADRE